MAEETNKPALPTSGDPVDPAAMALALAHPGALDPRAAAYLSKQSALADEQIKVARVQEQILQLQVHELRSEDRLRHRGLYLRHASDAMKVAFELSLALVVIAVVTVVASAVWSAAHDNGLVIEAFSVPPDLEQRGVTGQVVASQMLDRLTALQNATISDRSAQSYASNWGDDIKVQIPDTGVSIGEFNRYLRQWLGHETHITGEVFHTANGVTVTARTGDSNATFSGAEGDLDTLVQKAAEAIYRRTQPYRFAVYAREQNRWEDSARVLREMTESADAHERAWAWIALGFNAMIHDANQGAANVDFHKAAAEISDFEPAYFDIQMYGEGQLGHDEAALAAGRIAEDLLARGIVSDIQPGSILKLRYVNKMALASSFGDYADAASTYRQSTTKSVPTKINANRLRQVAAVALAFQHDGAAARELRRGMAPVPAAQPDLKAIDASQHYLMEAGLQDWPVVAASEADVEKSYRTFSPGDDIANISATSLRPWLALAKAKLGDGAAAWSLIATTPGDCYLCVRMRGNIAALAHRWDSANFWFAEAVRQAPSLPFAYADWGAMLMAKGDFEGAVAKFRIANQKGPHFADPLEMWGEALMRENRSDLALAKFTESNKYAPNWGRLHLKWGEAFLWTGDKVDAHKQFAIAATLDLSASDRAQLAKVSALHG
jgi:tetratricopeptide (TPR) repeat protein